jgi:hypothetical protein
MLTIRVEGDKHPKVFVFETDDAQGELVEIADVVGHQDDDPLCVWFADHTSGQFGEGVAIPADLVGDFQEVLWAYGSVQAEVAAEVIDNERQSWMDEIES